MTQIAQIAQIAQMNLAVAAGVCLSPTRIDGFVPGKTAQCGASAKSLYVFLICVICVICGFSVLAVVPDAR